LGTENARSYGQAIASAEPCHGYVQMPLPRNTADNIAMFASKATSAKVSLKVTFRDDIPAGGLLFTFTSANAGEDRTAVQDTLIPYITANRSAPNGVTPAAPAAPSPVAGPSGEKKRKAMDPATPTDTAPGTPSAVAGGVRRPQTQMGKIRLRVLRKNPTLKMLHTELVLAKEITEEEFWDGREVSYMTTDPESQLMSRLYYKLKHLHMNRNQVEHLDYSMIDSTSILAEKGEWQQEEQELE